MSVLPQDLLDSIEDRYGSELRLHSSLRAARSQLRSTIGRLGDMSDALQRRANLNLAIGSTATAVAIATLAFLVFQSQGEIEWPGPIIRYYLPRTLLAVFIEIFAFFFLRLYRTSLDEIKYFQNELTNVEARSAALDAAAGLSDEKVVHAIIQSIAATERNFVLRKGETTSELERARIHSAQSTALYSQAMQTAGKPLEGTRA